MEITFDELRIIADNKKLDIIMIEKDYLLTYLLYLLKDIEKIYFKGGTALNKIFLNHERLSEDLDFTVTGDIVKIEKEIKDKLKRTIFNKITHEKGTIFIDLNKRAKIYMNPEESEIRHFYPNIPKFKVKTLDIKELIAEKIAAVVTRYAPRDYYDIYNIIKKKLPVDMNLVKKKFRDNKEKYDMERIIRRGNKVYSKWESDLLPLTSTKPDFKKVIETLAEFFKYRK